MSNTEKEQINNLCEFIEDDTALIKSITNEPIDSVHEFLKDNQIDTKQVMTEIKLDMAEEAESSSVDFGQQLQHIISLFQSRPALSMSLALIVGIIGLQYIYPEAPPEAPEQERGLPTFVLDPVVEQTSQELENLNTRIMELYESGQFVEAEILVKEMLTTVERTKGPDHLDTAHALNNLAVLEKKLGKYSEADQLYHRALSIQEAQLGKDHTNTLTTLNNMGLLYEEIGQYKEAESIYQEIFETHKHNFGFNDTNTIESRNNLMEFYKKFGNSF